MRKPFQKKQKVTKGTSTAVLLSIAIHAALFFLAGLLVVFTVVKKEEKKFEPPKAVERPKMKLKKPKVKIKKSSRPKPTTRIVTKVNRASMPDIQLPEVSGIGDGLDAGGLGGFDMMPDLEEVSVFGSGQSIGNDFVGTFYDLKRDRNGRDIPMDPIMYLTALKKFVQGGWKTSALAKYYHSPKKLYATSIMIPTILSSVAPAAFGEDDTLGYLWAVHYTGKLVHKDGITFRFWGQGDDILLVRVNGEIVLSACWPSIETQSFFAPLWSSTSADSRKYWLGNNLSEVGDWITLEPGIPLDMEVLIGEKPGGAYAAMLLVEVKGVEYEKGPQGNPLLPMFMTAEPSLDQLDIIYRDLVPGEASVTNGPVFSDYDTSGKAVAAREPDPIEPVVSKDSDEEKTRIWNRMDGTALEAKFVTVVGDKAVLEDSRGKQRKILLSRLSAEDRTYVELANPPEFKINFSKKSSQFIGKMSPYNRRAPPRVLDYVFSVRLKQISAGAYNHELHVEFFAIGAEIFGDHFILLDHQESRFTPTKENRQSYEFSGKTVRLTSYELYGDFKGIKYEGYLVVVTDSRGKIIAHDTSNNFLFENIENLRQLPVGRYMDKTCTRVFPSRPITDKY